MIPSPGWIFVIVCVLLTVSGLLASLRASLVSASRAKLNAIASRSESTAFVKRIESIEKDPEGHAAAIAIPQTIINLIIALGCIYWFVGVRGEPYATIWSILIGILIGGVILWPVTTLIPMGIANHAGERTIALFTMLIRNMHMLMRPILPAVSISDEIIRRLTGNEHDPEEDSIGAELMSVVSEGEREGQIDETERDMLEAVVEFRSTLVESIMTPRTEMDALEYTDDLSEVQQFVDKHGHSRVPVYEDNLDRIVGILYAKDLLKWIINHGDNGHPFILKDVLRDPSFVPETKTVRELLSQLLADQVHIAMILDEYGGTSGLVTMEDIVEEVFGEIQDEYESPDDATGGVELDPAHGAAEIDARTEIDDANDALEHLDIEIPESDDYDTVGGYINTTLGRIPEIDERFNQDKMLIEILEAEPTRVIKIRVTKTDEDAVLVDTEEPAGSDSEDQS